MITTFDNGPFVHAVGWTSSHHEVGLHTAGSWAAVAAEAPIAFDTLDGVPRLTYLAQATAPVRPLPQQVLRASGVARARSAAASTIYAGLVARTLRRALAEAQQASGTSTTPGDAVGIAVVSSSANVQVFFDFESVGVAKSWHDTDAMLLPASIPSAGCTAASMVTDSHASAITLGDGLYGVCAGIEHAQLLFQHDRANQLLLLAAEEVSQPMARALQALGDRRAAYDGCAGLLLSATPLSSSDWQVCAMAIVPEGQTVQISKPWRCGSRVRVHLDNRLMAFTSTWMPLAVLEAMRFGEETDKAAALIEFHIAGRGSIFIALRHTSRTASLQDRAGQQEAPFSAPSVVRAFSMEACT